jgi:hypothetical protein
LAKGERRILKLTRAFQRRYVEHIEQRVALERRQCETLLRLERDVPHGSRTQWKWELALALQHFVGSRYSVAGIEERLTAARRAELDPGYWTQLASACLSLGSFDFRRAHRALKPKEEEEDAPEPGSEEPGCEQDEDNDDDDEGGNPEPPDKPPLRPLPPELIDILDAEESASDAELAAALAQALVKARAEVAALATENARLKAEVERLSSQTK